MAQALPGRILNRDVLTPGRLALRRPTGAHSRFHHAYQQATTMTFSGVTFGQIGTAFEVRTRRASLRSVGVFSNRYLLWAIAGELAIAAVFVFAPRVKRCSAPPSHPGAICC